MGKDDHLRRVVRTGIVAILRTTDSSRLIDVAEALLAGGIDIIEVTFTVPRAEQVLADVAKRLGDRILLGAGTVLDPETARIAILAGAQFLVSPVVRPSIIQLGRRYGKPVFPGAFTPTEVLTAWEAGADIVKVFPSDMVGPGYLKALRAPLPDIRLMPTGGVNLQTLGDFLRAGACAVGIGSSLVEPQALAAGDFARIESLGRQYVQIVAETRAAMATG
jgi:2-dehydro-3-deoxyphosphogluconate aldolase / (4S)-4-hydroxy-2-oxoglutarate aldolase